MKVTFNIETKNVIKILALAVGLTVGVFALLKMRDAITLILISGLLALALNPAVTFLAKYIPGKRRGPAVAIVFVAVVVFFGFLVASIVPPIVKESSSFAENLPSTVDDLRYRNEHVTSFVDRYHLQGRVDTLIESTEQKLNQVGDSIVSSIGGITSSVLNTLSVIVVTVLLLTGGPKLIKQLADRLYLNEHTKKRHEELAEKMYRVVTGYVNGQVLLASVAALFALSALVLLRVPFPLPLAAIVFVLGLIPLVGNTMAAILVVLAALIMRNFTVATILLAYFIIYQQIENATLQPVVQGKTTQLPPLVIFVAVILGVGLLGPIGGLFAIPAAGCARILFIDYLHHRDALHVGDSPKTFVEKLKHRVTKSTGKAL